METGALSLKYVYSLSLTSGAIFCCHLGWTRNQTGDCWMRRENESTVLVEMDSLLSSFLILRKEEEEAKVEQNYS